MAREEGMEITQEGEGYSLDSSRSSEDGEKRCDCGYTQKTVGGRQNEQDSPIDPVLG